MISVLRFSLLSLALAVQHGVAASFGAQYVDAGRFLKVRQDPGGASPSASSNQSAFLGYQLYTSQSLDASPGLSTDCEAALTDVVACDDYTRRFQSTAYRGSLDNDTLTRSVCDQSCGASLQRWFNNVQSSCGATNNSGLPWTYSGGKIWSGYNETCLKDPNSGSFCNDLIAQYQALNGSLSKNDTCSYCNVQRLAIMQESAYSDYNTAWQSQLQNANAECSLSLPTEVPESLYTAPSEERPSCYTGTTYTTQAGDSCTSISLANNVSSYTLFTGNQDQLQRCQDIEGDLQLCVPIPCSVAQVRPNDTCTNLEQRQGLEFGSLAKYNSWIWNDCSNLADGVQNYGDVVCVSPQGGLWNETSPDGTPVGNGGSSNFWSDDVTAPPNGSTVAEGTTLNCGIWYVAMAADSCAAIMVRQGIPANLFFRINPSLHSETCDSELVKGDAYCVSPTMGWAYPSTGSSNGNGTDANSTTVVPPTTNSPTTSSSTSSSYVVATPNPSDPSGTVSECSSFYIIQHGDTCPLILLKFLGQLNLQSLLHLNLNLGLDCNGLKVGMMICIAV